MDLELENRVCVVTGASSGIGLACARALAREGAKIAIAARGAERLREAAAALENEAPNRIRAFVADATRGEEMDTLVKTVEAELGPIEAVVANAGGPKPGEFEALRWDDWLAAFGAVVGPPVHLLRAALPGMLARRRGCFVSIQSTSIRQPIEGLLLSNALRPCVAGLLKSLSQRHAKVGVRFHVVAPGSTATDRLLEVARLRAPAGASDEEALAAMAAAAPLGRLLRPEEVAAAVAFLASPRASGMTGCFVPVDGGAIRSL